MLPGIRPEEIESIADERERLEAYKTVYKAFYNGIEFRRNVAIENKKQTDAQIATLKERVLELEWSEICI